MSTDIFNFLRKVTPLLLNIKIFEVHLKYIYFFMSHTTSFKKSILLFKLL